MLAPSERKEIQNLKQITAQVTEQSNKTMLIIANGIDEAGPAISDEQRTALVSLAESIRMFRAISTKFSRHPGGPLGDDLGILRPELS